MNTKPTNISEWIEANRNCFKPPICNKLLFTDQLKVFFVGGPNERCDYHIEEGEELFYMLKGDMCLKVVEHGVHKTIDIREGEAFLLPARIPHSPQRKANSMGLVIERERTEEELDGLRYYVPGTKTILFERWFHCSDLGSQLEPVIKEFLDSNEYRTGIPSENSQVVRPPFADDGTKRLMEPLYVSAWLKDHEEEINGTGYRALFEDRKLTTRVHIYGGDFKHVIDSEKCETFVWQMTKSASIEIGSQRIALKNDNSLIVPSDCKFALKTQPGGFTMIVSMSVKNIEPADL